MAKWEPLRLSDLTAEKREAIVTWAMERVAVAHESPARDAAVMLLDLVKACREVAGSSIDDDWLRNFCDGALYGSKLYLVPWYCQAMETCEGPCGECKAEVGIGVPQEGE